MKLIRSFLLVVILQTISDNCLSCINEYRAKLNGSIVIMDDMPAPGPRLNIKDTASLLKELIEADSLYRSSGSIEDYSDYGAKLIYLRKYNEAKRLFFDIEKKSPGLYATASNLGTMYELIGNNDSALFWIKKAVKLNPDSHFGSEWIHVKILEAKIASKGNPNYFNNHSILGFDFGDKEKPNTSTSEAELHRIAMQLYHQLSERISFIQPKDPVVAQLLFDLGNMFAITQNVHIALDTYESAEKYGYTSDVMEKRKAYFIKLKKKADVKNNVSAAIDEVQSNFILYAIAAMLAVVLLFYLCFRLFRKKQVG